MRVRACRYIIVNLHATMYFFKKLDRYIFRKYLLLFVGSFCVCQFVFMMQFTWKYADDLVGKGLSLDILGKFFWYMALTLVPSSLPLAILLSSLISFGNMSENLELLSIRAAGVSLVRMMRSIFVFALMMVGVSFLFQNKLGPDAQVGLRSLLISMRQTSPEVGIPEGVFYSGIPNVNLYVQRKTPDGMLHQVIIYKTDQGFDRAQIVLADSARILSTRDRQQMTLDLWNGEQFENLQSTSSSMMGSVPYDRETFLYKHIIIDFDSNFNPLDEELLRGQATAKSEMQIMHDIDSLKAVCDSAGLTHYAFSFGRTVPMLTDSARLAREAAFAGKIKPADFDSLISSNPAEIRNMAQMSMSRVMDDMRLDYSMFKDESIYHTRNLRMHYIEFHQKLALSLACLLFFFIGVPLGAAIGKGGLGISTVVSVVIFVLYYIVNTSGMKLGREGDIPIPIGMWMSTVIMIPTGIWLTYKCHHDKLNINIKSIWKITKLNSLSQRLRKPWKISRLVKW